MLKIKQVSGIALIVFLAIALVITVLSIWGVISSESTKMAFTNTVYTVVSVYVISVIAMAIYRMIVDKK